MYEDHVLKRMMYEHHVLKGIMYEDHLLKRIVYEDHVHKRKQSCTTHRALSHCCVQPAVTTVTVFFVRDHSHGVFCS